MKIALLWPQLSGYMNACLKELASRPEVELLVAYAVANEEAPFDDAEFSWIPTSVKYTARPNRAHLLSQLEQFRPDVLLVSSWHVGEFRHVLRHLRPRPLRVLCMDNQWSGRLKQRLGVLAARWYLHPLYDAVFLPGERQASFAQRLGFESNQIWRGLYCPDATAFTQFARSTRQPLPKRFGYLGRLIDTKGVQDLLAAYERYRASARNPWDLVVAGAGPLASEVARYPHVQHTGFVQPRDLPRWLGNIGCLVVPSHFEPWGVVIAEAAASGLPIIASEACGAGPHLVHDFVNGRISETGSVPSLAECLRYISAAHDADLMEMGDVSRSLVRVYTPKRWADTVLGRAAGRLHVSR
jgi:glycosyltransferase involved in cell wall biosynthesis